MLRRKNGLPIGIQFFAEESGAADGAATPAAVSEGGSAPDNSGTDSAVTYTQEQINAMMANEKRTARSALLKELGYSVKDDKSYRETVQGIKATLDASKTKAQLDAEGRAAAERERDEARAANTALSAKVAALSAGVDAKYLDDVITLASARVNDDTPIETVISSMKTSHPMFFSTGSSGTGTGANPANRQSGTESLGTRLGKASKSTAAKSAFFKN